MRTFSSAQDWLDAQGETLGTSDWVEITQDRVNSFADATGDHQWIHVDVERAKKESPFGGPIAHGFLTLSLVSMLGWQVFQSEGAKMGINYGTNKVRFPAPVPVGSKVRSTVVLTEASMVGDAVQAVVTHTLEVEGGSKPACIAETVTRIYY
jgi:acyl dehydratase